MLLRTIVISGDIGQLTNAIDGFFVLKPAR